jgi:SAM-dependent methyltransferase
MDYDATEIPAVYDLGRDHGPAFADLWMTQVATYVGGRSVDAILDLGCGTGRFSNALADRFNASLIGLDPSKKMLAQARSKESRSLVTYARGAGEALPLRDGTLDLISYRWCFITLQTPGRSFWSVAASYARVGLFLSERAPLNECCSIRT